MTCDRCGKEANVSTMSMFNIQEICVECKAAETERPDYQRAVEAEWAAVAAGDLNFPGIGLSSEPT